MYAFQLEGQGNSTCIMKHRLVGASFGSHDFIVTGHFNFGRSPKMIPGPGINLLILVNNFPQTSNHNTLIQRILLEVSVKLLEISNVHFNFNYLTDAQLLHTSKLINQHHYFKKVIII